MNTKYLPRRIIRPRIIRPNIIRRWAAVTGMLMVAATVQADMLSSTLYGDELDRCTTEIRSELNLADVTRLQHTLTEIDKVGVWYVFDILTTAYDNTDAVMVEATTHCKAHRWTGETVVDVTNRSRAANDQTRVASAD